MQGTLRLRSRRRAARPAALQAARRARLIARFAMRRVHERDFEWFRRFRDDDGLFVDVGANLGQSACSARAVMPRCRILSLEPNPAHHADLRWVARVVRRMEVIHAAASDRPGVQRLHVPFWKGAPITGEASLNLAFVRSSASLRDRLGDRMERPEFAVRSFDVPLLRIDDLRIVPRWLKVDVQGHAPEVLRGARETLRRHLPPVMVEADRETNGAIAGLLGELGYTPHHFDPARADLRPYDGEVAPQNLFFLPAAE